MSTQPSREREGRGIPWVGIGIPNSDPFRRGSFPLVETAQEAERLGFDSVWVADHLSFRSPWVDSTVALATVASQTTTIGLGYAVLLAALRQPVLIAKQIASLQIVSGNRLRVGIGIGGENPAEWSAAGIPMQERASRTDAFLEALPSLLAGRATHLRDPFDLDVPPLSPAVPMPPLLIGGRGHKAIARAIKNDASWLPMWVSEARIRSSRLLAPSSVAVSPSKPLDVALVLQVSIGRSPEEAHDQASAYIESMYGMPYNSVSRWVIAGPPKLVSQKLLDLHTAGVSGFIIVPLSAYPEQMCDQIAQVVRDLW